MENKENFEYNYNETMDSKEFGNFIVLLQSYDFVNLETDESKEVFNVAIEHKVDETYSETIDLFESYEQVECSTFYEKLIKNIEKVGSIKW